PFRYCAHPPVVGCRTHRTLCDEWGIRFHNLTTLRLKLQRHQKNFAEIGSPRATLLERASAVTKPQNAPPLAVCCSVSGCETLAPRSYAAADRVRRGRRSQPLGWRRPSR